MDGHRRFGFRKTGTQSDDAGDVHRIWWLADAAEDGFIDEHRVDPGAGEQRTDGMAAEFNRIEVGEVRSSAREGRPNGGDDDQRGCFHGLAWLLMIPTPEAWEGFKNQPLRDRFIALLLLRGRDDERHGGLFGGNV